MRDGRRCSCGRGANDEGFGEHVERVVLPGASGLGPEVCRLRTHKGTDRGRKSLALALALAREEPAKRTYFTCSETALIELQVGSAADLFSILSARGREIGVFYGLASKGSRAGP